MTETTIETRYKTTTVKSNKLVGVAVYGHLVAVRADRVRPGDLVCAGNPGARSEVRWREGFTSQLVPVVRVTIGADQGI
jgi:hypothetical protein